MTSESLLDAIGQVDDDLVLEAAAPARRPIPWGKAAGLAAALFLLVGLANLPGLLPFPGADSGAAAPESDRLLEDVMMDVDTKGKDYEYRVDQESQVQTPSQANKSESMTAGGTQQDIMEPKFFTERGVYLLVAPLTQTPPPEGAKALGELAASVPGKQAYPSTGTQALVGCPVWEREDGEYLYVQLPDSKWLTAKLYK